MPDVALIWFRNDLRLRDNPALTQALARHTHVIPVYIHAPAEAGRWAPGAASRWWLHHSLAALDADLRARGSRLLLRAGPSLGALRALLDETGADTVYWNHRHEPGLARLDRGIAAQLQKQGIAAIANEATRLFAPGQVRTRTGTAYRVFTPYWRACLALGLPADPLPAPRRLPAPPRRLTSLPLAGLALLPTTPWDAGLRACWTPGEAGALARLREFIRGGLQGYTEDRDAPARDGGSRLSPHLHFGELGPRQIVQAVQAAGASDRRPGLARDSEALLRQLVWREFTHEVLHHHPHTSDRPLDPRFEGFPWRRAPAMLRAWQQGRSGIPIVDAGMRELWHTGFMHNRVRMIAASFLTKHARIDWRHGARWFWDTLVDADLANNSFNWQWVAGCGADAAPYFRIFNPVRQSQRFDPDGHYLRRWLPELRALPDRWLHAPWTAPATVLTGAGLRLGRDYPRPLLDLAGARDQALVALRSRRRRGG